jgi:hypothetical protein
MKSIPSTACLMILAGVIGVVATGCGPSPEFEPEAAVPQGAVVVPNAASGGVSCSLEPRLRSRLGPETKLRIVNDTPAPMQLWWLDYAGRRRSFGSLAPGQSALKLTYAGHVWIATDLQGRCEGAAVATNGLSELRVGNARPSAPMYPSPASGEVMGSP